jgi:hypothetical protein
MSVSGAINITLMSHGYPSVSFQWLDMLIELKLSIRPQQGQIFASCQVEFFFFATLLLDFSCCW